MSEATLSIISFPVRREHNCGYILSRADLRMDIRHMEPSGGVRRTFSRVAVVLVLLLVGVSQTCAGGESVNLLDRVTNSAAKAMQKPDRRMQAESGLRAPLTYQTFGSTDWAFRSQAQNAYLASSAVFACVTCYNLHYPQIRFQVTKGAKPGGEPWPEHPLQYILDHPNDDMDQSLWGVYNVIYTLLGGVSHQMIYRNARGQIVGFRPYSPEEIRPVQVHTGEITNASWIDHYVYSAISGATTPQIIDRSSVISLPFLTANPLQPWLFVSPFAAAFLDIQGDLEMSKFPVDLMKNGAFVSLMVSMPTETAGTATQGYKDGIPDSVFHNLKAKIIQEVTGRNKMSPLVLRGGAKAEMLTPDFHRTDYAAIGERFALRICADARVPAIYAGISESSIKAMTYDNVKLAQLGFVKHSVLGLATLHARLMTHKFQQENWMGHPMGNGTQDFTIDLDLSGVQALKEEQMDKQKMATMGRTAMTINEYRSYFPELGELPKGIDGNVLMPTPMSVTYPTLQDEA